MNGLDLELIFRFVVAAFCGICIGYERLNHNKAAGVKTHMIVCMSAALMMIASKYAFFDIKHYDAARIAAQVVSGVSFLGAGIIFKKNNNVLGLTTAAGIWGTASVGLVIGAGMYFVGLATTGLFIILKILVQSIEKFQSVFTECYVLKLEKNNVDKYLQLLKNYNVSDIIMVKSSENHIHLEVTITFSSKELRVAWENELIKLPTTLELYPK